MVKPSPAATAQVELVETLHAAGKPLAAQPERTAEVDETGAFRCAGDARPMTAAEKYEFDRLGDLVLRDFLSAEDVLSLRMATEKLEAHANAMIAPEPGAEPQPPYKLSPWGRALYHYDPELGYHVCIFQHFTQDCPLHVCFSPLWYPFRTEYV